MKKVIISFTSYPARIENVHKVVKSLLEQTEKPDEIVLWLSLAEFPKQYGDLPESLNCLIGENGFRIEWVKENLKSHKKYFYVLQNNENIVITVDDDVYYHKTMVHTLMESYKKHPCAVSARNVHMIFSESHYLAPYIHWESYVSEYEGCERMDLCAIGVGGVLYPPGCAADYWFDRKMIQDYAQNQDDLWLKYNQIIAGIPVVYTRSQGEDVLIKGTQDCALHLQNASGGGNDICIKKLTEKLTTDVPLIYHNWFRNLMNRSEFLFYKRKYYRDKIENIVLHCGEKDIYICGAGKYARILWSFINKCGYGEMIQGFLVSQKIDDGDMKNIPEVKQICELDKMDSFAVICGVSEKYRKEMIQSLELYKKCVWIDIDLLDVVRVERLGELIP